MNQFVMLVDYVDPSLHGFQSGVQEQELLSRKSSASSTASLDRHEIRWVKEYMAYSCSDGSEICNVCPRWGICFHNNVKKCMFLFLYTIHTIKIHIQYCMTDIDKIQLRFMQKRTKSAMV